MGTGVFFRFSLAPAVGRSDPETALSLIPNLTPRLKVVGESLTIGDIGLGIGLAHRFGYVATPTIWIWRALVISIPVLFFAFLSLHHYQIEMSVEFDSADSDGERVDQLNDAAMKWLMAMTGLLLLMLMAGIRGMVPVWSASRPYF